MPAVTYKKSGVDIDKADAFVKRIKPLIKKTGRPEVLGKVGGFNGLFMPRLKAIKNPVLVSSTDGVGMVLILGPQNARRALQMLEKTGPKAWVIGEVIEGTRGIVLQE